MSSPAVPAVRWLRALVVAGLLALTAGTAPAAPEPLPLSDGPAQYEKPQKPSGFWTSNRPAKGGAYRYRLLGIGIVLAGITGYFLVRTMKRADRERAGLTGQAAAAGSNGLPVARSVDRDA